MSERNKSLLIGLIVVAIMAGAMINALNNNDTKEVINEELGEIEELGELGDIPDQWVPLAEAPIMDTIASTVASGTLVEKNNQASMDYSNTKDGYFMVAWTGGAGTKIKLQSKGPSGVVYTYDLDTDGQYDAFPFSDGNGSYTITVFKNVTGTKYSTVLTKTLNVTLNDEMAPFLRPNQYVNYTENSKAVKKAAELCEGLTENLKKVEAVYDYVVATISYDREKAATVQSGYLPDIDKVLDSKKGICFDYASLMSAMLRSQNVPVKLVTGYTGNAYHAWINVWSETEGWVDSMIFFDGKQWKLMDPTYASSGNKNSNVMKYIGDGKNYQAKYLY